MRREINVPGKDFCDMSAGFDKKFEDYAIVNAMLPRVYYPLLQGNIYEKRAASIARQLFPDVEMGIVSNDNDNNDDEL
jgi:phytanoyl-CoA hydroxylase